MSKPYIDFVAIKAAVSITQVLEHYGLMAKLKPCGADGLRGNCPIHEGNNPKDFSVSISKNCWHCFSSSCDGGGNTLDLVARLEDVDVHQAALLLNEWFNLGLDTPERKQKKQKKLKPKRSAHVATPDPESSVEEPDKKADSEAATEEPAEVKDRPQQTTPASNKPLGFELKDLDSDHPYFAERGLEPQTVEHFGLGFCQKGTMAGRIAIPMHNADGELVGYAGRWPGEPPEGRPKYKLPKGFFKTAEVFNLHRLDDNEDLNPLIVVEGFFDCMWLWQHGYHHCVALIGSSMSDQQQAAIAEVLEKVDVPLVELLFDEDDAGRKGRDKALCRLADHAYIRKVPLDDEGRQPDGLSAFELANLIG